jgi:hypothetical protein
MDSNNKPFKEGTLYKIVGKRNGNGPETTFFATFVKQEDNCGSYILIQTGPGNIFYQYFSDITSIKPATFLDMFLNIKTYNIYLKEIAMNNNIGFHKE